MPGSLGLHSRHYVYKTEEAVDDVILLNLLPEGSYRRTGDLVPFRA